MLPIRGGSGYPTASWGQACQGHGRRGRLGAQPHRSRTTPTEENTLMTTPEQSTDDRAEIEAGFEADANDADYLAAADGLTASPETQQNYPEALTRGADQQGEGRVP